MLRLSKCRMLKTSLHNDHDLFGCLWFFVPLKIAGEELQIEQWGFFSVPQLLWHGTSVYNGHPVILTPIAERLAVGAVIACFFFFYELGLSLLGFSHPAFRLLDECSNRLHHRVATMDMSVKYRSNFAAFHRQW